MKNYFIVMSLFLASPAVVAAQEIKPTRLLGPALMDEQTAEAQTLCEQLLAAYQNYSHNAFADLIAETMIPSKLEFINTVEQRLAGKAILSFTGDVLFVIPQGDKQIVQLQWEKKYQTKDANAPTLETGNAMLVFIKGNATWQLLSVSGDNPF